MAELHSEDLAEERKPAARTARYWQRQIQRARHREKDWREAADKVLKRYRDERRSEETGSKRLNILYSNVETLRPAIYANPPKPDVRRRYLDQDPVARMGAEVMQRALSACIDLYDLDGEVRRAINDYLLPSRGVARVRYRPIFTGAGKAQKLVYQEALTEYVHWSRFVMLPATARHWKEVRAVCFGADVTPSDAEKQFGKAIADELTFARAEDVPEGEEASGERGDTALVWEVWSRDDRRVYVIADQQFEQHLVEPKDDPLGLEGFYPMPEPLYALPSNDTLVPRIEFALYQDQAQELDDLSTRIQKVTDELRVRGIRDAGRKVLEQLATVEDGTLLPVDDFLAVQAQGGLEKLVAYLPIDHLAAILLQLYDARERVKAEIYEIMGIADILRGASDPRETASAQNIKSRWAGLRVSERQQQVEKWLRNLLRIKAEIVAEHFTPETLAMMTNLQLPTPEIKTQAMQAAQQGDPKAAEVAAMPTWEEVLGILRQDKLRGWRIDIETDSTVRVDAETEQRQRTEAITAIGTYLERAMMAVQAGAMDPELAKELLLWTIRAFKVGPQLEQLLERLGQQGAQQGGASPEMQQQQAAMAQQQQAIGQQAAELAKLEKAAVQRQHQAELAEKDVALRQQKLDAEIAAAQQERKFYEDLQRIQEQMEGRLRELAGQAEGAVAEAHTSAQSQAQDAIRAAQEQAKQQLRPDGSVDMGPVVQQLQQAMKELAELKQARRQPRTIEYDSNGEPVKIGGQMVIYGPDGQLLGVQ